MIVPASVHMYLYLSARCLSISVVVPISVVISVVVPISVVISVVVPISVVISVVYQSVSVVISVVVSISECGYLCGISISVGAAP